MESSAKKVIMISGANRGIGRAIAERLLADGYLLSLGVRNLGKLPKTLKTQVETQTLCHSYDARDRESAKRWVNLTAEKFGLGQKVLGDYFKNEKAGLFPNTFWKKNNLSGGTRCSSKRYVEKNANRNS